MAADLGCYNIADLRERARRRLPLGIWEYAERGVEDECGIARNRAAFDAIKRRERNQFLEDFTQIGGEIRLGEDQAKDGVAIWEQPAREMGQFSIFVSNLSGESVTLKDDKGAEVKNADGKPTILRKTLQLNYFVRGDTFCRAKTK